MKSYDEAYDRLAGVGQEHLLAHWDLLNDAQKERLLSQILTLDLSRYDEQRALLAQSSSLPWEGVTPFVAEEQTGSQKRIEKGKELLRAGKVGCLILSGGHGTRLRYPGPKGFVPITLVERKSLYQLLAEKCLAASALAGRSLPMAIMTSTLQEEEIHRGFAASSYFGVTHEQLAFFSQGNLPILDDEGKFFLEGPATIAEGPNGNGDAFDAFIRSGIFARWIEQGIRYVHVLQVDNPLADPFDAEMIGFQAERGADIVMKCVEKEDPEERVGIVVNENERLVIKEYIEIPPHHMRETDSEGRLIYRTANLTLLTVAMDFIRQTFEEGALPLHKARKTFQRWFPTHKDEAFMVQAWKSEMFLFDVLPRAHRVEVLLAPRESCFAPLKNATGPNSIRHVQEALEKRDRATLHHITGKRPPEEPFELDPLFYYPTPALLEAWREREPPAANYIRAF